jgi:hypothetical protein
VQPGQGKGHVGSKFQGHYHGAAEAYCSSNYSMYPNTETEVTGFSVSLLGFGLYLLCPFIVILFFSFGLAMLTLNHCILEICNFFFDFTGVHN